MERFVVICDTLVHGPFSSEDEANDFAASKYGDEPWDVLELIEPSLGTDIEEIY